MSSEAVVDAGKFETRRKRHRTGSGSSRGRFDPTSRVSIGGPWGEGLIALLQRIPQYLLLVIVTELELTLLSRAFTRGLK